MQDPGIVADQVGPPDVVERLSRQGLSVEDVQAFFPGNSCAKAPTLMTPAKEATMNPDAQPPSNPRPAAEASNVSERPASLRSQAEDCFRSGDGNGGIALLRQLEARLGTDGNTPERRAVLAQLTEALLAHGQANRARETAADLEPLCRATGDAEGLRACEAMAARADLVVGLRLSEEGRYDDALGLLGNAETLFRRQGDGRAAWTAFRARSMAIRRQRQKPLGPAPSDQIPALNGTALSGSGPVAPPGEPGLAKAGPHLLRRFFSAVTRWFG